MARKKKLEFRPDPTGSGLLSKLYLTNTQRKAALKWTLYSLVWVAVMVCQDVIWGQWTLFHGRIDLTPCVVILICVLEGAEGGSVFALLSSLFYAYSGSAPGLYVVGLLTVVAIFAAIFRQDYLQPGFFTNWLCTAAAGLVYQLCVYASGLFLGQTYAGRIDAFLMNALLTAVALPVVYPLFHKISRIGGEPWNE